MRSKGDSLLASKTILLIRTEYFKNDGNFDKLSVAVQYLTLVIEYLDEYGFTFPVIITCFKKGSSSFKVSASLQFIIGNLNKFHSVSEIQILKYEYSRKLKNK